MALIAAQYPLITGKSFTFAAANGGGDTLAPTPTSVLHVKNGGGSSINVSVVVPGTDQFGQARPDIVRAVPAGEHHVIGPLSDALLVNPSTGVIDITYSSVTSVTVAHHTTG